jgi:diaminopimelate decarboxylase
MTCIAYRDRELFCEDVSLRELAEEYDTPLYVYSKNEIVTAYRSFDQALGSSDHRVCYALKANSNLSILRLLAAEGAGADVVSGGELSLALKAGFPPERIVFAGVGKREEEIEYALREGIAGFNVESVPELQTISRLALRHRTTAPISLRINPDVNAQSHPYITTGLRTNKFGIESSKALEVYSLAASLSSLDVAGVHTHIGSQITSIEPFVETAHAVVALVQKLREAGINLRHIDFGGGIGVRYFNAVRHEALVPDDPAHDQLPAPSSFVAAVLPIIEPTGCSLWFEPGRAIVAEAGVLLTRVLYLKDNGEKRFIIVDAAMNDLMRPSLYQAHHQIVPTALDSYEHMKADVVGPICETGDFLARDRMITKVKSGDVLAVLTAGAYGFVMASQYNGRPRPAEILVNGDRVRLIHPRETYDDLY